MNVRDYLDRIGYNGDLSPTLSTLKALSWAHKRTVCYTNLHCFGGKRTILDLEFFYKKIVTDKCGGICYEINGLFIWLLRQLGFKVIQSKASNYSKKLQGFTETNQHSIPLVDFGSLGKYIVDPGYLIVGPMQLVHMTPHVEKHAIYRFRQLPDQDNLFCIERHKKTLINEGIVMTQGPAPPGTANGLCNAVCQQEQSEHWEPLHTMCAEEANLSYFIPGCNWHHDTADGAMVTRIILRLFTEKGYNQIHGTTCNVIKCIDPVTEKILVSKEITNDSEVEKMAKDIFGYEVKHPVTFFKKSSNFTSQKKSSQQCMIGDCRAVCEIPFQ